MQVKATVLVENSVFSGFNLLAEHDWSVFLETGGGNFLFDTGQGKALVNNAKYLGKDLSTLKGIIISHHHYDHTGGLLSVLEQTGPVDVYAHPDLFKKSYVCRQGKESHIGIPFSRAELEKKGARFHLGTDWQEIIPGMCLTGEIPRLTPFEKGPEDMFLKEETGPVKDPLLDDQCLVFLTPQGLSVILGCAHAGIVNTLNYVLDKTRQSRINVVMGGTHLGPQDRKTQELSIEALKEMSINRLGVSHCTGLPIAVRLAGEFGSRFFFANVGTTAEL